MNRIILAAVCILAGACSGEALGRPSAPPQAGACEGGVVRNDAELERFRGCRRVSGDLEIRGVASLESLESLREVEGALSIADTRRLYTLSGLERLRGVGMLELRGNAALIHGGALRNLSTARHVRVVDNPRLSATSGFLDGITRAGAEVAFSRNWGLAAEGVTQSRHDRTIAAR